MTVAPPYRKKLIEVALPLDIINNEARKTIRGGTPHKIHYWWAHRPLIVCRVVLFASLVDDPSSWPELFPSEIDQINERERLFSIIEGLVKWDNPNAGLALLEAQKEIARSICRWRDDPMPMGAEEIRAYIAKYAPPVIDPFCGGGSIPIEAQRLGLISHSGDLNPIAVLITKSLIELPPKFIGFAPVNPESRSTTTITNSWDGLDGLVADLQYYGMKICEDAKKRIGHLFPKINITTDIVKNRPELKEYIDKDLTVIAWFWARTVTSPNPAAKGAFIPLIRSYWLSTKKGKEAWLKPITNLQNNTFSFEVHTGIPPDDFNPNQGTVGRKGGRCILYNSPITLDYIRDEGKAGRLGKCLIAMVVEGKNGKIYLPAIASQSEIAESKKPINYPESDLPEKALGFRVQNYGMDKHYKLYTNRQLIALTTFSDLVKETRDNILNDRYYQGSYLNYPNFQNKNCKPTDYPNAIATYLSLPIGRAADYWSTISIWHTGNQQVAHMFTKQTIQMTWDFVEANPFSGSTGSWESLLSTTLAAFRGLPMNQTIGTCDQFDATKTIGNYTEIICSTDPPYYANIGYADLSDIFYIWHRRTLGHIYPSLFSTLLTPKKQELIASPYRHDGKKEKAQKFFEDGLKEVFSKAYEKEHPEYPITVYYAYKQSEDEIDDDSSDSNKISRISTGWDTILNSLIRSGLLIQGTWPIKTEPFHRMVARGTNSLDSSIVLVCRPRPSNAPLAIRREFITALKQELPKALKTLQQSSIAPVDLAQAAIGPGMAIFTRYSKVMESDGSPMTVRTALSLINQALDEVLAEQEGEFDGDTRWALGWFEQYGNNEGPFGDAETLSKAKNTAVNGLIEAGIIAAKGGKVKILTRDELREEWDPTTDRRPTIWEATHYLIKRLERHGEQGAADLLLKLGGGMGEAAKDLAYRLYVICDRKKWSQEALGYNSLIVAWPEITKLVQSSRRTERAQRMLLGEE